MNAMDELDQSGHEADTYVAEAIIDYRRAQNDGASFISDFSIYSEKAKNFLSSRNREYSSYLVKAYDQVSKEYKGKLTRLVQERENKMIYIPPIASVIFDRATDISNISAVAIEVRDEFKQIRNHFYEYESRIRDESLSLKESLGAIDELDFSISSLSTKTEESSTTVISEWRDLTDFGKLVDGLSASDGASISKLLLGKPLEVLSHKIRMRNVQYFLKVQKDFLKIKNYGKLIERVFKTEVTSAHIDKLNRDALSKDIANEVLE